MHTRTSLAESCPIAHASIRITRAILIAPINVHRIMEIHERHAGHHHTVNIKYGYILFGISVVDALAIAISNQLYKQKWTSTGRPNTRSIWYKIGSCPVWAHVAVWAAVIVGLSFANVHELGENYAVVIKRIGRLAYALVPLDVLLAIRPAVLGGSYLDYVPLHKWLLRLIVVFSVVHGVGFFVKWFVQGAFWSKTLKWANFLGVVVAGVSVVLVVVSLRPLRRRMYGLFYLLHNFTVAIFVVLITFHARPGVSDFVVLLVAMVLFQLYQRLKRVHVVPKVSIIDKESASLRIMKVSKPSEYPSLWVAGSHVRLGYARSNFRFWLFPSHPYTLSSLPTDDTLDLVVKKGFRFQVFSSLDYTVSGPFESLAPAFFATAENVNILCGGSGISLGIPIFRYLKHNSSVHVKLFWCVSNKNDAYVLNELKLTSAVDVYVTNSQDNTLFVSSETDNNEDNGLLNESEQFELETLALANSDPFGDNHEIAPKSETVFHTGRPNLDEIFLSFSETQDSANKWAIACGPQSLIEDVRKWTKKHDVQLFTELYDM